MQFLRHVNKSRTKSTSPPPPRTAPVWPAPWLRVDLICVTTRCITTANVSPSYQLTLVPAQEQPQCVSKRRFHKSYPRCAPAAKDAGAKGQDLICYVWSLVGGEGVGVGFGCPLINCAARSAHKSILLALKGGVCTDTHAYAREDSHMLQRN